MKKMNKKGFTLIEMLVVVAIIAILAAILIPTATAATEKSKQAADLASLRSYIAEYNIKKLDNAAITWPESAPAGVTWQSGSNPAWPTPDTNGNITITFGRLNPSQFTWNISGLTIS